MTAARSSTSGAQSLTTDCAAHRSDARRQATIATPAHPKPASKPGGASERNGTWQRHRAPVRHFATQDEHYGYIILFCEKTDIKANREFRLHLELRGAHVASSGGFVLDSRLAGQPLAAR
jgi:hypothetical protein